MTIEEFFKANPKPAIAFSGGTDSAYLLYEAKSCGADAGVYYVRTGFQPEFEFEDAVRLAEELGIKLRVIEYSAFEDEKICENTAERCYLCKKKMLLALKKRAAEDGFSTVIDGTNASDDGGDRPGMRALAELGVRSPLRECGLTKSEIRRLSKAAGLFTYNKPSYACLATRIPTGEIITPELLEKTEKAEAAVRALGFSDFRIRVFNGAARIQVKSDEIVRAAEMADKLCAAAEPYFDSVLLDLSVRR